MFSVELPTSYTCFSKEGLDFFFPLKLFSDPSYQVFSAFTHEQLLSQAQDHSRSRPPGVQPPPPAQRLANSSLLQPGSRVLL